MSSHPWWIHALATCAVAAWWDHRTRTVPNKIWALSLLAMAPLLIIEMASTPTNALWRVLHAAGAAAVLYGLWLGRVFQAGDAKGLMVLSLALSPVDYYDPLMARISPVLDTMVPAFLVNHAWIKIRGDGGGPLMVSVFLCLLATRVWGGILWWPIVVWA